MNREGIKIAVTMTLALFISQFFQLPKGYWVLVTMGVIYLAGSLTGLKMEKINKRIIGSFVGLILGILIMQAFGYYSYRVMYLVPLTWFFMFYLYFLSENYTYVAVFVSIMLLFSIAILAPEYNDFNILDTAVSRIICTVVGVIIILITEYVFFHEDSKADTKIYPEFEKLVEIVGSLTNETIKHFIENRDEKSQYFKSKYFELFDEIYKLRLLLKAVNYEISYNQKKKKLYEMMCDDLYTGLDYLREAIFIAKCKEDADVDMKNIQLFESLSQYFKNDFKIDGESGKFKDILSSNKNNIINAGRNNQEYYFLQSLTRIAVQLRKIKMTKSDVLKLQ